MKSVVRAAALLVIAAICITSCGEYVAELEGDITKPLTEAVTETVTEPEPEEEGMKLLRLVVTGDAGLYDFGISIPDADAYGDDIVFYAGGGNIDKIPFSVARSDGERSLLGTFYMEPGTPFFIEAVEGVLPEFEISLEPARAYFADKLVLSMYWMRTLYSEEYGGWVEAEGWDDMWTMCQYLPEKFAAADIFRESDLRTKAQDAANRFLIGKMLRDDGMCYTVYKAADGILNSSRVEPQITDSIFDLWRGNAAFAEEMINCQLELGGNYIDYAKIALDAILNGWQTKKMRGISVYTDLTDGGYCAVQSVGRLVMVLCRCYELTGESKYLDAAITQGDAILKVQTDDGRFASDFGGGWAHCNAFANALFGLSWLYRETGGEQYSTAIEKAVTGMDRYTTPEYGNLEMAGKADGYTGASVYSHGRMAQAVITAAYFTGKPEYYRAAERLIYYCAGRNSENADCQNPDGSWRYYTDYTGASNVETSSEVNLALLQYELLTKHYSGSVKAE